LVKGGNWNELERKTSELLTLWKTIPEITDVDTDLIQGKKEIHIIPDRFLSAQKGVSIANMGGTIGALMGGKRAGRFTENGRGYDVRVKIEKEKGESRSNILDISVRNTFGEMVRIRDFLRLEETESLQNITRVDRLRAIKLFANPEKGQGLSDAIETTLKQSAGILPKDIFMETTGSAKTTEESFQELMFTLVLGIIVSYMILGSQFNSFLKPVYILLALPFSFTGAFLALKLGNFSFNIYSFIGIILLLGLVKKNSILLVEFMDLNRTSTKDLKKNIVNACPVRLRPILMTTCTSLVAALPPALSLGPGAETRIPMAVVILGGMSLSTLVTLYLVPVAYYLGESRNK
jgi:multidrug efflux pump subunit AcrB